MLSSQSFAVGLSLFLLGTMAIVAVFLPIGCGAMKIGGSAVLHSTNVIGAPPAGSNLTSMGSFNNKHRGPPLVRIASNTRLAGQSLSVNNTGGSAAGQSAIVKTRVTGNAAGSFVNEDNAGGFEELDEKNKGHGLHGIFPPPAVASSKKGSWRVLQPDMSDEDLTLAGNIQANYATKMHVPNVGLDTNENVKTAIEMIMSMPKGNRDHHENQKGLKNLAIALGIREHYINLLSKYEAIKKKEAGHTHTEANEDNKEKAAEGHTKEKNYNIVEKANALGEEKSKLADGLFGVLTLGDQGTGNPKALARTQAEIVKNGREVLKVPPEVKPDALANGKHENPVVAKKAKLLLQLKFLHEVLHETEEYFEKQPGHGQPLRNKKDRFTDNAPRIEAAMEVMEKVEAKMIEEEARSSSHAHHHVGEEGGEGKEWKRG